MVQSGHTHTYTLYIYVYTHTCTYKFIYLQNRYLILLILNDSLSKNSVIHIPRQATARPCPWPPPQCRAWQQGQPCWWASLVVQVTVSDGSSQWLLWENPWFPVSKNLVLLQPLSIITRAENCGLEDLNIWPVFPFASVVYIYICMYVCMQIQRYMGMYTYNQSIYIYTTWKLLTVRVIFCGFPPMSKTSNWGWYTQH